MKGNNHNDEKLFYRFIESADRLPIEGAIFPFFDFMDQSIRKSFHQLKKTQKTQKGLDDFKQFWQSLENQSKVNLYCNWTVLLKKALELEINPHKKIQPDSLTIQDQIYIKTTTPVFNKWEKKIVKLSPTRFTIVSKKNKEYELKNFQVRKAKSKQMFTFVLQPIINKGRVLQCGFSTQSMFQQWFFAIGCNINNERIQYFLSKIRQERANPGSTRRRYSQMTQNQSKKKQETNNMGSRNQHLQKTQTEIMIEKQMKSNDLDNFSDQEQEEKRQQSKRSPKKKDLKNLDEIQEEAEEKKNPNVFRKLAPHYYNLMSFADTPVNCSLLHCDSQYRVYELPSKADEPISLKFFTVLPYPKNLIFQAIVSESMSWNDEIDIMSVKTKISSQNTVLFYEKNKPQGLLYRERDFLYLRHCFSVSNFKQKNTFIIDKSIDSIHHPPFMTVVRAQKQLIWGIIQKQSGKQCILIVQGWIKGGGYMNNIQNKQMTIKYMKKLTNLNGFVKQLSFSETNKDGLLFKENYEINFNQEQQEESYHSTKNQFERTEENENNSSLSTERRESEGIQKKDVILSARRNSEFNSNVRNEEEEMAEFMKRTTEQIEKVSQNQKSQINLSENNIGSETYIPPKFTSEKFVIIPNGYVTAKHIIIPKQKPKKPKIAPHYRGHHLWKGQWDILPSGGLGYVDQEKMKEQKKVLTYIIKRIGRNIFSGKGILNISLPVDIFCVESNIERLAMSFGFFPHYLEKAASINKPQIQLKYIVSSALAGSLIYMTMEKPFNPILGQTFQCWIDGCPVYFQQISHHPPIAAFLMKGRGYTVSGCVEAKMDLSINSGTGSNEGIFTVEFDSGNKFYYTTSTGCLTGLTYGDRKLNMIGKCFYWDQNGLMLELVYNPGAKNKGFFGGGNKVEGDQKLCDYVEGYLREYKPSDLRQVAFKKTENNILRPIYPKNFSSLEPIKTLYKVYGRWNKYLMVEDQKLFDVNETRYFATSSEKNPLPSHSNFRQDIVYRRMRNFVISQDFKQTLEIRQREDRKLRAKLGPKNV